MQKLIPKAPKFQKLPPDGVCETWYFFPPSLQEKVGYICNQSNFIIEYLCFDAKSCLTVAR